MRKTKIICTLGPATDKGDVLRKLMESGADVLRLNFSHQTHAEQKIRADKVGIDLLKSEGSVKRGA